MTGGGGGGGGNTTTTTSGPPANVSRAYDALTQATSGVTQQPLNLYGGPMVAGFSPQQQEAFQRVEDMQGSWVPYTNAAAQSYGQAMTPLDYTPTYDTVQNYINPYTKNVTDALTALFNNQNQQGQQQVQGNAAARGAYGGDREAVAQALLAQQQQLSQAPTLANVLQTGYQQSMVNAQTDADRLMKTQQAQRDLALRGGAGLSGLGAQAQSLGLGGAQALLGVGGLQQQLAQQQLNVPYQQFIASQAYPYQQLGFAAPIIEGTGSLSGTQGTSTTPGPTGLSQLASLGTAGLGLYGAAKDNNLFNMWGDSSGGGGDYSGGGDLGTGGLYKRGGGIGYSSGGGIGYAAGGSGGPAPEILEPGFGRELSSGFALDKGPGDNVPVSSRVEDITTGIPKPAPSSGVPHGGMGSAFEPVKTQTTSSGGGGGSDALGTAGQVIGIATKVLPFLLANGGRVGIGNFAAGGGIGQVGGGQAQAGNEGIAPVGGAGSAAPSADVPTFDLSMIIGKPQQAKMGPGPEKMRAPAQQPTDQMGDLGTAVQGLTKAMKKTSPAQSTAEGGHVHREHGFDFSELGLLPMEEERPEHDKGGKVSPIAGLMQYYYGKNPKGFADGGDTGDLFDRSTQPFTDLSSSIGDYIRGTPERVRSGIEQFGSDIGDPEALVSHLGPGMISRGIGGTKNLVAFGRGSSYPRTAGQAVEQMPDRAGYSLMHIPEGSIMKGHGETSPMSMEKVTPGPGRQNLTPSDPLPEGTQLRALEPANENRIAPDPSYPVLNEPPVNPGMSMLNRLMDQERARVRGTSGIPSPYAGGGTVGYADGGAPAAPQDKLAQLMAMPVDQLQQLASTMDPNSPEGQAVQQILAQKQVQGGPGNMAQAGPPGGAPGGGIGAPPPGGGLGGEEQPQPQMTPGGTATTSQMTPGGTSHVATGGVPPESGVHESELDPKPVLRHQGGRIHIDYPSEKKTLDTGMPSFRKGGRTGLAEGGKGRDLPVHGGEYDKTTYDPQTWLGSPGTNPQPLGAGQDNAIGPFGFLTSPSGLAIPQIQQSQMFRGPPTTWGAGQGYPGWFAPLDQYRPPGMGNFGPGGSMVFPHSEAFTPGMASIIKAANPGFTDANLPPWAGGPTRDANGQTAMDIANAYNLAHGVAGYEGQPGFGSAGTPSEFGGAPGGPAAPAADTSAAGSLRAAGYNVNELGQIMGAKSGGHVHRAGGGGGDDEPVATASIPPREMTVDPTVDASPAPDVKYVPGRGSVRVPLSDILTPDLGLGRGSDLDEPVVVDRGATARIPPPPKQVATSRIPPREPGERVGAAIGEAKIPPRDSIAALPPKPPFMSDDSTLLVPPSRPEATIDPTVETPASWVPEIKIPEFLKPHAPRFKTTGAGPKWADLVGPSKAATAPEMKAAAAPETPMPEETPSGGIGSWLPHLGDFGKGVFPQREAGAPKPRRSDVEVNPWRLVPERPEATVDPTVLAPPPQYPHDLTLTAPQRLNRGLRAEGPGTLDILRDRAKDDRPGVFARAGTEPPQMEGPPFIGFRGQPDRGERELPPEPNIPSPPPFIGFRGQPDRREVPPRKENVPAADVRDLYTAGRPLPILPPDAPAPAVAAAPAAPATAPTAPTAPAAPAPASRAEGAGTLGVLRDRGAGPTGTAAAPAATGAAPAAAPPPEIPPLSGQPKPRPVAEVLARQTEEKKELKLQTQYAQMASAMEKEGKKPEDYWVWRDKEMAAQAKLAAAPSPPLPQPLPPPGSVIAGADKGDTGPKFGTGVLAPTPAAAGPGPGPEAMLRRPATPWAGRPIGGMTRFGAGPAAPGRPDTVVPAAPAGRPAVTQTSGPAPAAAPAGPAGIGATPPATTGIGAAPVAAPPGYAFNVATGNFEPIAKPPAGTPAPPAAPVAPAPAAPTPGLINTGLKDDPVATGQGKLTQERVDAINTQIDEAKAKGPAVVQGVGTEVKNSEDINRRLKLMAEAKGATFQPAEGGAPAAPAPGGIGGGGGLGTGIPAVPAFSMDPNKPSSQIIARPGGVGAPGGAPIAQGTSKHPISQGSDGITQSGAHPNEITSRFQGQRFDGKAVNISSGWSNQDNIRKQGNISQADVDDVNAQIKAAKDGGAKEVRIIGVGTGVTNSAFVNKQLKAVAEAAGATFVPLAGTERNHGIHPEKYETTLASIPNQGKGDIWMGDSLADGLRVAAGGAPAGTGTSGYLQPATGGAGAPPGSTPIVGAGPGFQPSYERAIPTGPGGSGASNVQSIVNTARQQGAKDGAILGVLANGLGEGGYSTHWLKAGRGENSWGHWQFNRNGELPGYEKFLAANNLPNDSSSQTKFVLKRMEELHPGFSQITDPKLATQLVLQKFEKPQGYQTMDRTGLIGDAQKLLAGDYSGNLGPRGGGGLTSGGGDGSRDANFSGGPGGGPGAGGIGATSGPGIGGAVKKEIDKAKTHQEKDFLAQNWFPILIAGLGGLTSRSPNAFLEGIKAAAPYFTSEQRAETARVAGEARTEVAAERNRTALQGIEAKIQIANTSAQAALARAADLSAHRQALEAQGQQNAQITQQWHAAQLDVKKTQLDYQLLDIQRKEAQGVATDQDRAVRRQLEREAQDLRERIADQTKGQQISGIGPNGETGTWMLPHGYKPGDDYQKVGTFIPSGAPTKGAITEKDWMAEVQKAYATAMTDPANTGKPDQAEQQAIDFVTRNFGAKPGKTVAAPGAGGFAAPAWASGGGSNYKGGQIYQSKTDGHWYFKNPDGSQGAGAT